MVDIFNGCIRLTVSTLNRTYELSGITHLTSFRRYGKHSTETSTYGPWVRTYSKLFSCKSVLTVWRYRAQSNEIHTYWKVSRGSLPRVRMYGLPYLRAVECDHQHWFLWRREHTAGGQSKSMSTPPTELFVVWISLNQPVGHNYCKEWFRSPLQWRNMYVKTAMPRSYSKIITAV